jgi:prepilin-type N-terminal cleavage/methylation domain-containing protein
MLLNNRLNKHSINYNQRAFTLLELLLVIVLVGAIVSMFAMRLGIFSRIGEDKAIAQLTQELEFLHTHAKRYFHFYQLELNLSNSSWYTGELRNNDQLITSSRSNYSNVSNTPSPILGDPTVGILSNELAEFTNPPLNSIHDIGPPSELPSLYQPRFLSVSTKIIDVVTPRGKINASSGVNPYIVFSPRGFTEFCVIHLEKSDNTSVTLVVNPFTGIVTRYNEYREFEWTLDDSGGGI